MIKEPLVISLETPHHIVRTVERSDATERWARWLLDPTAARQLNAPATAMTVEELKDYIDSFDRVNKHLFGIFDKETALIVGIRSIQVSFAHKSFFDNILIGEVEARGKYARAESTDVLWHYFFEVVGLENLMGTVRADNKSMLDLFKRKGFAYVRSDMKAAAAGGGVIEIQLHRLTRDTRRRWLAENAAEAKRA